MTKAVAGARREASMVIFIVDVEVRCGFLIVEVRDAIPILDLLLSGYDGDGSDFPAKTMMLLHSL